MPRHDDVLNEIDDRIAWILRHPGTSPWLKTSLRTALERDPIAVVNDLETLSLLLRARADALVNAAFRDPVSGLDAGWGGTS